MLSLCTDRASKCKNTAITLWSLLGKCSFFAGKILEYLLSCDIGVPGREHFRRGLLETTKPTNFQGGVPWVLGGFFWTTCPNLYLVHMVFDEKSQSWPCQWNPWRSPDTLANGIKTCNMVSALGSSANVVSAWFAFKTGNTWDGEKSWGTWG